LGRGGGAERNDGEGERQRNVAEQGSQVGGAGKEFCSDGDEREKKVLTQKNSGFVGVCRDEERVRFGKKLSEKRWGMGNEGRSGKTIILFIKIWKRLQKLDALSHRGESSQVAA